MRTKDLSTCFFLRNSIYSPAQQTKIKGTGKRNTNIEILRILLMLMVCFLHLAVHGYGYFSHNTHPLNNVSDHSFLLSLLVSLTIPAVNTYVLISGYFGIKFKWNSVFAFAFQALFFSFIRLSGNFWLLSFKISYLCLPLFYETRTTPSCHPSGCAYRQL